MRFSRFRTSGPKGLGLETIASPLRLVRFGVQGFRASTRDLVLGASLARKRPVGFALNGHPVLYARVHGLGRLPLTIKSQPLQTVLISKSTKGQNFVGLGLSSCNCRASTASLYDAQHAQLEDIRNSVRGTGLKKITDHVKGQQLMSYCQSFLLDPKERTFSIMWNLLRNCLQESRGASGWCISVHLSDILVYLSGGNNQRSGQKGPYRLRKLEK